MGKKTGSSQFSGNSRSKQHNRRGRGRGGHHGHGHGQSSGRGIYDDGRPDSAVDSVDDNNSAGGSDDEGEDEENASNLVHIDVPVAMWVSSMFSTSRTMCLIPISQLLL